MRIIWSPLSLKRVKEIASYIAQDKPSAAIDWVNSVFKVVQRLKKFPKSGRMMPEIAQPSIREIIFGNYRIIYRIQKKCVAILTVRYSGQILPLDEISG